MTQSTLAAIFVALMLGVLGAAVWYSHVHPRRIVGHGTTQVGIGGRTTTLRTRDVSINGVVFQEVELPGGTWTGCNGDCAQAAHDAGDGFWDQQNRDHH